MPRTFYDVLGVGRDASRGEIEAAYRERVKETHPDVSDAPDASEAFKRVQVAEEVLSDPEERARYDRMGHASYTSRVSGPAESEGYGWEVGSDPTPEEAGFGPEDVGDRKRSYTPGDGGSSGDGFGFDPGAYDSTSEYGGAGNPSERSYDVSWASDADVGGSSDSGGGSESSGGSGGSSGGGGGSSGGGGESSGVAGGARAGGSTATEASASGHAHTAGGAGGARGTASGGARSAAAWQNEAERVRERWSKDAQRAGRGSDSDADRGYSVHEWDAEELSVESKEYPTEGSELVALAVMFVLYPFMVYSAVAPAFSLFVNVTVAVCVLVLTGYVLTMPRIGFYVFGAWSVLAPFVVLVHPAFDVVSLMGIVIVGAAWIPFGYSVLFMRVVR